MPIKGGQTQRVPSNNTAGNQQQEQYNMLGLNWSLSRSSGSTRLADNCLNFLSNMADCLFDTS